MDARPRFLFKKTMAKLKLNQKQLLIDFSKRLAQNANGVKSFLAQAGIEVPEGQSITYGNLIALRDLNPEAFNNMIVFLYPELFEEKADGDGKGGGGLDDTDKEGMFGLFGNLINVAGEVLGRIFSPVDQSGAETARKLAEIEAARTRRTLIWVGSILALLVVMAFVLLLWRGNGSTKIVKA